MVGGEEELPSAPAAAAASALGDALQDSGQVLVGDVEQLGDLDAVQGRGLGEQVKLRRNWGN